MIGADAPMARSAGATHEGRVRDHNEDAYLLDDARGVWAVADGMGGHAGGAEASAAVVTALAALDARWTSARALANHVIGRIEEAHASIRHATEQRGLGQSGSTVACLAGFGPHALVAWCGDSRIYRRREREGVRQMTRDHTLVQGLVDAGRLSIADAERHPEAHVLTRAVGAGAALELDFRQLDLRAGDRFLICSDGLTRPVPDPEIAAVLQRTPGAQAACDELRDRALAAGAPDNVTVVVVDFT